MSATDIITRSPSYIWDLTLRILGAVDICHRIDRVHDQVEQHLLQLDPVCLLFAAADRLLGLDDDRVLLQIRRSQRQCFANEFVDVEYGSVAHVALEIRANASDHLSRTMAVGDDLLERIFGFVEIGLERSRKRNPASALVTIAVNGCLTS